MLEKSINSTIGHRSFRREQVRQTLHQLKQLFDGKVLAKDITNQRRACQTAVDSQKKAQEERKQSQDCMKGDKTQLKNSRPQYKAPRVEESATMLVA